MFATGSAVFLALLLILIKLPRRLLLRLLRYDIALDIGVTLLVMFLHWGSFDGVMAATVAGLMTSFATSAAKRVLGYIDRGVYVPGLMHLEV
ncbi:MAG: hypothetical protein IPF94_06205 [Betaproteobacteria bacterium]|nr:hypothetical protein [Betaproteobacteria bacterium]